MKTCICGEPLTTREQLRRGFCTDDCQRKHTPRRRAYSGSRAPNTSQTIIAPKYHSRHGTDNRKGSAE